MMSEIATLTVAQRACQAGTSLAPYTTLDRHESDSSGWIMLFREQTVYMECLSPQLTGGRLQLPDKCYTVGGYE